MVFWVIVGWRSYICSTKYTYNNVLFSFALERDATASRAVGGSAHSLRRAMINCLEVNCLEVD